MVWAYLIFSLFLGGWTYVSQPEQPIELLLTYAAYVGLTLILGGLVWQVWYRPGKASCGVILALTLSNIGASIAYRMGPEQMSEFLLDLMLMIPVFLAVYLTIRFTRIYSLGLLNWICMAALPVVLVGARLTGAITHGSYLYFCGIMVFGIVLAGYPFVVAHFMRIPQTRYRGGNVKNLSWNLMGLLLYTFLLFGGCVLCNEFGLLLILGLTATVIFFIRCKNLVTKCVYSLLCAFGAGFACMRISHIRDRVQIWVQLEHVGNNEVLAAKAESVLYLFRHFKRMGWWGNGLGNLPKSYYPTLNSDHVLVTLINDYSVIFAVLALILGILYVKWMLTEVPQQNVYDRYLGLTSGLIVGFMLLIHVASSLGSSITAGIGFIWASAGSAVNMMLTVLLAVHAGIMERQEKRNVVLQRKA